MEYTDLLAELESVPYYTGHLIAFTSGEQRQRHFNHYPEPESRLICPARTTIQTINNKKKGK
jgi:hypothetical protein